MTSIARTTRRISRLRTERGTANVAPQLATRAWLTVAVAADLLNVSLPYFDQLLQRGDVCSRGLNSRRRVRYQDVIDYKRRTDGRRRVALDELAAQAQELGMGY